MYNSWRKKNIFRINFCSWNIKIKNYLGFLVLYRNPSASLHLANGELKLAAGHPLLLANMRNFRKLFKGQYRVEVGPLLTTRTVKVDKF